MVTEKLLQKLAKRISGDLHADAVHRHIYATDASVYRQIPAGIVVPRDTADIRTVVEFCKAHGISITPRAGGTSLAGQAVGDQLILDVSKYMTDILEVNTDEQWVRVQPGVIRDALNNYLATKGLFFGPNTSTSNRAMIGGMVGNNSCGTTSIRYGSTRDHVLELHAVLADGSECIFKNLSTEEFDAKCGLHDLEGNIYKSIREILDDPENRDEIIREYPKPSIHRRNTGYALDLLLGQQPWSDAGNPLNISTLLCGSEGTLACITEIKLGLDPLPPPEIALVCAHFSSLKESMTATQVAMTLEPYACELMDRTILECTRGNKEQLQNRSFVSGDPAAVLMVEFRAETTDEAQHSARDLIEKLKDNHLGYAYPVLFSPQSDRAWNLRAAGLGVLANLPGDAKAVACIEDTAVALGDLPEYIEECDAILAKYGQQVVHYAHAGAGEIHIRPILDLKKSSDRDKFYEISREIAELVKKYNGSLSGEHGDGRVRSEFIPLVIGEKNYALLRRVKSAFDPENLFNPGKIVDPLPVKGDFRYESDEMPPELVTEMDFSDTGGFMRMVEKCNGVGACRKTPESGGGTMCPSYMATRDEKDTTRARANALREFLKSGNSDNPFDSEEVFEILKLCLSCKGCTTECPSSVDMTSLKAEFLHQYYKSNKRPLSDKIFGNFGEYASFASLAPGLANTVASSGIAKRVLGIATKRSMPRFATTSLRLWHMKHYEQIRPAAPVGDVHLFCDEFTNFQDVDVGIKAIRLLTGLGYHVSIPDHFDSGRTQLSKGLLTKAKYLANANIEALHAKVKSDFPLVGIEPSAILSFRDEYLRLANDISRARELANSVFTVEEFIFDEVSKGRISPDAFTADKARVLLHGHCHQKALSGIEKSAFVLGLPANYSVEVIPSGCCGMAGSFGYEADKYNLSMQIAEMVLFPAIREAGKSALVAAPGTSCRHQVLDGLGVTAMHPAEILCDALTN